MEKTKNDQDPVSDADNELDKGASISNEAGVKTNADDETELGASSSATPSAFEDYQSIRGDVQGRQEQGDRSWRDLSEYELNSLIANPIAYGKYLPGALQERERRFEEKITGKFTAASELSAMRSNHPDAFNPNTPLGREVNKIMGQKSYSKMLGDVMELAENRISKSKIESEARKKLVTNLGAAMGSPGTDVTSNIAPPSWGDMTKQDFEAQVSRVKLERKE